MVRDEFRLDMRHCRELPRQYRRNLCMIVLPRAFEQRLIRCLPNERLSERIEGLSITSIPSVEYMSLYKRV